MRRGTLSSTQSHHTIEGEEVHGIAGIDESTGSSFWKTLKAGKRLFDSDECAGSVDVEILFEGGQVNNKWIISRSERDSGG